MKPKERKSDPRIMQHFFSETLPTAVRRKSFPKEGLKIGNGPGVLRAPVIGGEET